MHLQLGKYAFIVVELLLVVIKYETKKTKTITIKKKLPRSTCFSFSIYPLYQIFYSYRIASIGDRSAAFLAGNTPKIIPIPDDTPIASTTVGRSTYAGKTL